MSREKSSRVLVIVLIATFVSCILLGMFAIRTPKAGNGKQKGLIWEPVGFVEYSWAQAETLMRKKGEWISSAKIEIGTGNLYLTLSGGDKFFITDGGNSAKCMEALDQSGIHVQAFYSPINLFNDRIRTIIRIIIAAGLIAGVVWAVINARSSSEITPAEWIVAKPDKKTETKKSRKARKEKAEKAESAPAAVHFSDVIGIDPLIEDMQTIVDSLRNPEKYEEMGAVPPHGVILFGPPGTGKTLTAKAIAGEAGVSFISASGSDFIEKYVGVGASRVRDLFAKARKSAPCVLFIDEVDAVAGQRGGMDNAEQNQTVNALLTELDGFKANKGVVVVCATNRLDMLDEAFMRSGRFDLKLAVPLPDKESREKILVLYSKNKKLADEVVLPDYAAKTAGFSGADLQAMMNEAAMEAVKKGHTVIKKADMEQAFRKIVMKGNDKKIADEETRRLVSWHEAGHTLAAKLLTDDVISGVSVIGSTSGAGGVTFRAPSDTNIIQSKKYMLSELCVLYAGRAGEELYFREEKHMGEQEAKEALTVGASQDIKQATQLIRELHGVAGFGKSGLLDLSQYGSAGKDSVTEDAELSREMYERAVSILADHKETLRKLADTLFAQENLTGREIEDILAA